jgi:hypothetical protein
MIVRVYDFVEDNLENIKTWFFLNYGFHIKDSDAIIYSLHTIENFNERVYKIVRKKIIFSGGYTNYKVDALSRYKNPMTKFIAANRTILGGDRHALVNALIVCRDLSLPREYVRKKEPLNLLVKRYDDNGKYAKEYDTFVYGDEIEMQSITPKRIKETET